MRKRVHRHTLLGKVKQRIRGVLYTLSRFWRRVNRLRLIMLAGIVTAVIVLCLVLFTGKAPEPVDSPGMASGTEAIALPAMVTSTPEPTPEPTIHPLNTAFAQDIDSPVVAEIQSRLMELGFMDEDEPTEHFGPITKASVKLFQRQHSLTVDGCVGKETFETLMNSDAQKYMMTEGDEGTDVKELQIRLRELGYINSATSYYGTETAAAIKKFQDRNGLSPDGKVGEKTREMLYSEDAKANAFAYGEESPEIKKFQERLIKLGYYAGTADGKYGKTTVAAVKRFQERHSIIADGYVGPQTKSLLMSSKAQPNALVLGMKGTDVEKVQTKLKELKYLKSVTGYYGTDTVNAVFAFQTTNGLKGDGKVGAATMSKLMSSSAKPWTSSAPPSNAPSGSGSGGSSGGSGGSGKPNAVDIKNLSGAEAFVTVAQAQLGSKYVRGGKGTNGTFDCSGFVYWCLNQAGVKQGYMTSAGWQKTTKYPKVGALSKAQRGDVLSFKGHVGIALGGGKMIDASSSAGKIRITNLSTPYWQRNFVAVYRVF